MTVHTTAHCKALKDLIEIMAIASALGFLADCLWIVVELCDYGIRPTKLFILAFLHIALFMQMYALYRFHGNLARDILNNMKTEKQAAVKAKARIQRRKEAALKRVGAK